MQRQQFRCEECQAVGENVQFARLSLTKASYLCPTCLSLAINDIQQQAALEHLARIIFDGDKTATIE